MEASVTIDGLVWRFDPEDPIDISIPLNFNGPQPNAFGVEPATAEPCAAGDLVGDTRQGGSCNFEQLTLIPHCNGTHTECVGHITHERISVRDCLQDTLIPAVLITVEPEKASSLADTYPAAMEPDDLVIGRDALKKAMSSSQSTGKGAEVNSVTNSAVRALIIRTLPNDVRKLTRHYSGKIPPYLTTEAMEFVVECAFNHLLIDLPSLDRVSDEGRLSNHRIFWRVEQGSFEANESLARRSTITEFIYVPNAVEDGTYILNLQIAPFATDASPSRPLLFATSKN